MSDSEGPLSDESREYTFDPIYQAAYYGKLKPTGGEYTRQILRLQDEYEPQKKNWLDRSNRSIDTYMSQPNPYTLIENIINLDLVPELCSLAFC